MKTNNEATLIAGLKKQEESSYRAFVEKYQDNVYGQALRMMGNVNDAEEACQDALIKGIKHIEAFKGDSKLSTWLFRIVYTTCLDHLKKRKRKPTEMNIADHESANWEDIDTALELMEQNEQSTLIEKAISQLGGTDALLIDLYHLQELSIKEIEEITKMKGNAIKVRLMRARKKLALNLKTHLPLATLKELKNERG